MCHDFQNAAVAFRPALSSYAVHTICDGIHNHKVPYQSCNTETGLVGQPFPNGAGRVFGRLPFVWVQALGRSELLSRALKTGRNAIDGEGEDWSKSARGRRGGPAARSHVLGVGASGFVPPPNEGDLNRAHWVDVWVTEAH